MITLGVDPGPKDYSAVAVIPDYGVRVLDEHPDTIYGFHPAQQVTVIEWPVSIGIPIHRKPLDETMRRAAILADRLHRAGVAVYIPPRSVILRQLGYSTRCGAADKWLAWHLQGLGYDMKLLRNTHLRAAMAAALFRWQHPQNAQYKYGTGVDIPANML